MKAIPPVVMTNAILIDSSVAEADYPAWAVGTTYALGDRVIKLATHRVYESLLPSNIGNDPAIEVGDWLDIGPTNRWAMFDQVLGTATTANDSIDVTLMPGAVDSIGLLDVRASAVRVVVTVFGSPLHDETRPVVGGEVATMTFLDLPPHPSAQVVVTISGAGPIAVGGLLVGAVLDLGETEAGSNIGLVDFSKRSTDDYGVTTVIERSWSKTMTLRSRIASVDADAIQIGMARLRAKPILWIGKDEFEALTIYGFCKSFSIDLALPPVSFCSFTIEGLAA